MEKYKINIELGKSYLSYLDTNVYLDDAIV